MSTNNVIPFPKSPRPNPNQHVTKEEVDNAVEGMHWYHIQEAITNIAPSLFEKLEILGFNITEPENSEDIKSGAFIVEAIRAVLCKQYGLYHPFQPVMDKIFAETEDEEGTLKIVNSINLKNLNEDEEEQSNTNINTN